VAISLAVGNQCRHLNVAKYWTDIGTRVWRQKRQDCIDWKPEAASMKLFGKISGLGF
jgi:hypothetical protein